LPEDLRFEQVSVETLGVRVLPEVDQEMSVCTVRLSGGLESTQLRRLADAGLAKEDDAPVGFQILEAGKF